MNADRLMQALSDELRAEIAASRYRSIRAVSDALGTDYTTLYRWVAGQRQIRAITVLEILELLGIDVAAFFAQVQARAARDTPTAAP